MMIFHFLWERESYGGATERIRVRRVHTSCHMKKPSKSYFQLVRTFYADQKNVLLWHKK